MKLATDEADVLARIVRWADAEEPVRLILLTSSRANPAAPRDLLSDYDPALIVTEVLPYLRSDDWLHGFGTPLLVVRDAEQMYGLEKHNCMVLYDDGTKIDYSIWPLAVIPRIRETGQLPEEFDVGYRALVDKDGLARDLPPASQTAHVPSKPTEQEFQALVEEFWWVTTYVAKNLWRDELMPVKVLLDYEIKYLLVRKLFEWRIEIDHHWSLKPGFFGRGLKAHLDAETWTAFEATYVGPDPGDNWAALFKLIALFRRVAVAVGQALGYAYPHAKDAQVMGYLRQIQRLADAEPGPPGGERAAPPDHSSPA
jgi:aminoglycoside 6-adenylyltransferase